MATKPNSYDVATSRNIGVRTEEQQEMLRNSTVLVAGAGGAGGFNAEALVREGVGGIVLAEPDVFDESNLNRQNGSSYGTIGELKLEVLGEKLYGINPDLRLVGAYDGVTYKNVGALLKNVDLVFDAIDISLPGLSVALQQEARRRGIPVMLGVDIAYGGNVFAFSPTGMTIEELIGVPKGLDPRTADWSNPPLMPFIQQVPDYVDLEVLQKVLQGELDYVPAIATSVFGITTVMCGRAVLHLAGEEDLIYAPRYIHMDTRTCVMETREII